MAGLSGYQYETAKSQKAIMSVCLAASVSGEVASLVQEDSTHEEDDDELTKGCVSVTTA